MEGVALDLAMGYAAIEAATGEPVSELLTIGGGAKSALMRRIVADATGRRCGSPARWRRAASVPACWPRPGSAGTATPAEAARAMQGTVLATIEPDPARAAAYRELLAIYHELYPALRGTFARLAAFRSRLDG